MEQIITAGIPAIIEAARGDRKAELIEVSINAPEVESIDGAGECPILVLPLAGGGSEVADISEILEAWREEHATRPRFRKGTAVLEELAAFTAHANRFRDEDSAIFVTGGATSPRFTSVLDYHQALNTPPAEGSNALLPKTDEALPRFGQHRGTYEPKFSPAWKAWTQASGKPMRQADFAALIDANVRDVFDITEQNVKELTELPDWYASKFGRGIKPWEFYADSERLLKLAEGFTTTVEDRVSDVTRRDSGETSISFEGTVRTSIDIPVAFVISLPVFAGSAVHYQIPVRVRHGLYMEGDMKRAKWTLTLFDADRTVLAVVADMREEVIKATGLPVLAGTPE